MTKGQVVNPSSKLVPYNAKLEASTKALLAALVQIQKLNGGQRELIGRMLEVYEAQYPKDVAKAKEIINLIGY